MLINLAGLVCALAMTTPSQVVQRYEIAGAVKHGSAPSVGDLPGYYYMGDGTAMNVTVELRSDGTYVRSERGCLGPLGDPTVGRWTSRDDDLYLKAPSNGKEVGSTDRLVIVRWGERINLVPPNAMPAFAASSNPEFKGVFGNSITIGNDIYSCRWYFKINKDGEPSRTSGLPSIPPQYVDYYNKGPVVLRVSEVFRDGRVKLARPDRRFLANGSLLTINQFLEPDFKLKGLTFIDLKVLSTTPTYFVAKAVSQSDELRPVRLGDFFTTGEGVLVPGPMWRG